MSTLYETEQYKDLVDDDVQLMQEGLIQADAVNTTETASTLLEAGTAFGYFTNLKPLLRGRRITRTFRTRSPLSTT